jgi:hypothetical protein
VNEVYTEPSPGGGTPTEAQVRDLKTSLAIPETFLKRADRLVARLGEVGDYMALGTMTRSKVLRLAIARGLDALEQEHGVAPRERR